MSHPCVYIGIEFGRSETSRPRQTGGHDFLPTRFDKWIWFKSEPGRFYLT